MNSNIEKDDVSKNTLTETKVLSEKISLLTKVFNKLFYIITWWNEDKVKQFEDNEKIDIENNRVLWEIKEDLIRMILIWECANEEIDNFEIALNTVARNRAIMSRFKTSFNEIYRKYLEEKYRYIFAQMLDSNKDLRRWDSQLEREMDYECGILLWIINNSKNSHDDIFKAIDRLEEIKLNWVKYFEYKKLIS